MFTEDNRIKGEKGAAFASEEVLCVVWPRVNVDDMLLMLLGIVGLQVTLHTLQQREVTLACIDAFKNSRI